MARSGRSLVFGKQLCFIGFLAVTIFSIRVSALSFVAGSKCESVCNDNYALTVHDDVRCLDSEFDTQPASRLRECVTCQLNSTAVDPVTKMTDVQWALFHLRYILANCMFAYPEERVSISSPCQVSCAPLKRAVSFGITNSTNTTDFSADLGFCTGGQFDDFTINNCAFCYSFIPQQIILGNFLQALHIACHKAPTVGKIFYPDGVTIFNQSAIQGPTDSTDPVSSGLSGTPLILAIVLSIVGGLIVIAGICCCCWRCSRARRAQMAASGRMSRYHDEQGVANFSPMSPLPQTPKTSPPQPYMWTEPPQEMHSISVVPRNDAKMAEQKVTEIAELPVSNHSPGLAQPRWPQYTKDESSVPLTSPIDTTSFGQHDDNTTVISAESQDPNLHEKYIGNSQPPSLPDEPHFQAQDGFVKEPTHGGWKQ